MWAALGKVTVAVAGTPRQLSAGLTTSQLAQLAAINSAGPIHGIMFQAWPANTGKIWVGEAGMNKTTGVQVGAVIAVPTVNAIPAFSMALTAAPNALSIDDFYLDADTGGDGVIVSVLVT